MNDVWTGLALVTAAGVMGGSFTVPLKSVRGWAWEKSWLLYSVVGMVIVPWLLVAWAVPRPAAVFAERFGDGIGADGPVRRRLGNRFGVIWPGGDAGGNGDGVRHRRLDDGDSRLAHSACRFCSRPI